MNPASALHRGAVALMLALTSAAAPPPATESAKPPSEITAADVAGPPAVEPADALRTFRIKPGYRQELAAAEPQTMDPIALCFDEAGRMWVVEMRDYSERRDEQLGRVSVLEDADGDGRFERSTVFAEELPWPTGLLCADGGVYVAASPDLLFLKDTDGDGKADHREVVFTGFGEGVAKLNVQALPNSLTFGIDGRIHGATAANGGVVRRPGQQGGINLRGRDFSFDPRARDLRAEAGGGQYGLTFDAFGRKFVCSNSHHIQWHACELRYAGLNPRRGLPSPLLDVAPDGPAAEVFRTSPDEAWRVIRTRWRVAGVVPGIIEGGGRPSGYFTSATGICLYTGDAMPELAGHAFIADVGSNLVHHKVVTWPADSPVPVAVRDKDEAKVEFLTSTDNWYRPVFLANGPDGALYVADMYRQIIEHPWSLPPEIKRHLDLNAGNDRGRIWRIVPENFARPTPASRRLDKLDAEGLAAALGSANGWTRSTAARLILERRDPASAAAVTRAMARLRPEGRAQALWVLERLAALAEAQVVASLADADPNVRRAATRLAETFLVDRAPSPALWSALAKLAEDADVSVRYQLAWTLGLARHAEKAALLARLIERGGGDLWMAQAVLNSASGEAGALLQRVAAMPGDHALVLRELAAMVGAGKDPAEVAAAVRLVNDTPDVGPRLALGLALVEGLGAGKAARAAGLDVDALIAQARALVADAKAPPGARVRGAEFLRLASYDQAAASLLPLLGGTGAVAEEVRLAALATLDRFTNDALGPALIERLPTMTPRLREQAVAALVKRPGRATALLRAIEAGTLRRSELASTQRDLLRQSADPKLRELAAKVLGGPEPPGARQEVVKRFAPALTIPGDPARGKVIFDARCASCHRHGGAGHALGPDLVTVQTAGRDTLLNSILDPGREVAPQYLAYIVETRDGDTLAGLVTQETDRAITLRQAYGVETVIPRTRIRKLRASGQSLMPENLEEGLSERDVADLLAFIARPG